MDMLVIGLCFTFVGLAITAMVFAAATRPQMPPLRRSEPAVAKAAPARFFAEPMAPAVPVSMQIPIEVLLHEIEHHVRLEQAAAESFVAYPSRAQLHSKTTSPLVN